MDNGGNIMGTDGLWGVIIFLIIAGIIGGNGIGFGGGRADISNEFIYNQMANSIRENNNAIHTTDRDVLENRYSLDKEILQNRYDLQLGNANTNSMMQNCCCELKTAIHSEGEQTRALITQNRIADLEKELNQAQGIIANTAQTQNILNSLGNYYPKVGVNPYTVYGFGTTLQ